MRSLIHGVSVCLVIILCILCVPISVYAEKEVCEKHEYCVRSCKDKYLATAEDGVKAPTYYFSCISCGAIGTRKFKAQRVLFVGNSKTMTHGSPAYTFEKLANYNNKGVIVTASGVPKYTLAEVLNEPNCYDVIANKAYDIVIIQENSSSMWNSVTNKDIYYSFKTICNLVIANNPDVKIYTRCPYLGEKIDAESIKKYKKNFVYDDYFNNKKKTKLKPEAYYYYVRQRGKKKFYSYNSGRTMAMKRAKHCNNIVKEKNRGGIIPDTDIMYGYKSFSGEDDIWDADGFHQNEKGCCLLACSFYRALYGTNPKMSKTSFKHEAIDSLITDSKFYISSYNDYWNGADKEEFVKFKKDTYNLLNKVYGKKDGKSQSNRAS